MKKIRLFLMCIVLALCSCGSKKSYTRYDNVKWEIVPYDTTFEVEVKILHYQNIPHNDLYWTIPEHKIRMYVSYPYSGKIHNCFYVGNDDYILVVYTKYIY